LVALVAYLAAQVTAALKRKALIYGLMAIGGLMTVFAAGYALNAGHAGLMFRYGSVTTRLIVAGCLLVMAIGCVVGAKVIAGRPRSAPPWRLAAPYSSARYGAPYSRQSFVAVAAGSARAASAAAALIKFNGCGLY
jgi:hypothetical protein